MLVVAQNLDFVCDEIFKLNLNIYEFMQHSTSHVHRLLHYHHNTPEHKYDDWCGWHNDHGAITVLTPAMNLDIN